MSFRLTGRDADLGATWMFISGTYVYVPLVGVESMGYVNTQKTTWMWDVL